MNVLRRMLTVIVLAIAAVAASGATAGAAVASATGAAARSSAEPQLWMILGGLATIPIALVALVSLLRKPSDAEPDQMSEDSWTII